MKSADIVNLMAVIPLWYTVSKYPYFQSKTNTLLWHSYMFRSTYRTIIRLSLENFCVAVYLFESLVTSCWWPRKWNETCHRTWWPRVLRRGVVAARLLGIYGCNPAGGHGWLFWMLCVVQLELSRSDESHRVCVIRCNNNPLHLQRVGSRGQTKKHVLCYHEIAVLERPIIYWTPVISNKWCYFRLLRN